MHFGLFTLAWGDSPPPTRLSKANAESELAMAVTAPYRSSKDAIEAIRKFFCCKYYRPPRGQNLASGHIS